ncbi:MAG TPA: biotin transporter BioY [Bacteroidetes bacterium]|nr:biotin transporter BioY [bacterium BMS3Bbin04]HDO65613.1 biotin transporter BioY [Bacteroidota bacterium]HEX04738.1 biotin transporter BioY [Bacteroidota bacterium]
MTNERAIDRKTIGLSSYREVLLSLALILAFTALTSLGALVRIPLPMTPVPITLQTLMVLLAGAMLGSKRGLASQFLYVVWGVSGLPLFAGAAAGFAIIAGPTGGYLIGFIVAAFIVGQLIDRADTLLKQVGVFSLGTAAILLIGWIQLSVLFAGGNFAHGLTLGVLPFLPGAVLKIAAATSIWRAWTVLRKKY